MGKCTGPQYRTLNHKSMPWPVLPYGFIGGVRKNAGIYGRQPPETLNILVVGGGGNGNFTTGNGGAAGGGGGVYAASVSSGALLSPAPVYAVVVGGRGAPSQFASYTASGGQTPSGCTGGAQGSPNGYGGGGGYGYGSGVNAGCGGGAGGSHSGPGVGSQQIGADYYLGYARNGYAVGSVISSLIGSPYVGAGGRGAWTTAWPQTNQPRYLDSGGQGAGGGGPRGNASYRGCGGGGGGGLGTAGVVVVSYAGTQAGPGGSVTYHSPSNTTYHVFTSNGFLEL